MTLDPYAGDASRKRIGADRIGVLSIPRVPKQDMKTNRDGKKDHDGHRSRAEGRVIVRQHADRLALRVVASEAPRTHHHAERRDERRNVGVRNQ